jgi:hypothetical protein
MCRFQGKICSHFGSFTTYVASIRRPQQEQKNIGVKRWYYLLKENPRIRLVTVGRPLAAWDSLSAKMIVGTSKIIGEFPGNRHLVGRQGLQMKCEPIEWLRGSKADKEFPGGDALLQEISEQILDRRSIDMHQRRIQRKYEHPKRSLEELCLQKSERESPVISGRDGSPFDACA